MATRGSLDAGHETADVRVRPLLLALLLLALGCAGAFWLMRTLFRMYQADALALEPPPHPMAATRPMPEGPRLQTAPAADMRAYLRARERELERYGWIDREAGVVRLPVERAAELVLEEGLPVEIPREEDGL
jgi:hypothetical protein